MPAESRKELNEMIEKYNPLKPEAQLCLDQAIIASTGSMDGIGIMSIQLSNILGNAFEPTELYILFGNLFKAHHIAMMNTFREQHGVDMMKDNQTIINETVRQS